MSDCASTSLRLERSSLCDKQNIRPFYSGGRIFSPLPIPRPGRPYVLRSVGGQNDVRGRLSFAVPRRQSVRVVLKEDQTFDWVWGQICDVLFPEVDDPIPESAKWLV